MRAWLRSWWHKIKQHPIRSTFVSIACVLGIVLLIGGYFFIWTWTGFGPFSPPTSNFQREKTLYDWLQLAIIPVVLAFGVLWFNRLQQQRDQKLADRRAQTELGIAADNQREAAMKEYFGNMSELLLHEGLLERDPKTEVRIVSRVLTLTVLHQLDKNRKRNVLQFLYESGLIDKDKKIIDLTGADIRDADLHEIDLSGADLSEAYLQNADLEGASLDGANLSKTNMLYANLSRASLMGINLSHAVLFGAKLKESNLSRANLQGAFLEYYLMNRGLIKLHLLGEEADLSEADLRGAKVRDDQLTQARSLNGATMPDGTKHA